jgi:Subtilase family
MSERTGNWFFVPRASGSAGADGGPAEPDAEPDGAAPGPEDPAPGLLGLPAAVLLRHGASVLDPAQAVAIPGPAGRPPSPLRSTVYRTRSLLVPDDVLRDETAIREINAVLARVGMKLVPPGQRSRVLAEGRPGADVLRRLPRSAALVPETRPDGVPAAVDAWVALQALRAAAAERPEGSAAGSSPAAAPALDGQVIRRLGLEHLLVGSALTITGSPAGGVPGGLTAGPNGSGGATGPTATDSYTYAGDTRTPVTAVLKAPHREPAGVCETRYGRRPVVAVLDTGVRAHWWLDVAPGPAGGYLTPDDGNGFVAVSSSMQDAIRLEGEQAAQAGDQPRRVISGAWDTPVTDNPLVGELNPDIGHGTFIAGIVRQVEPDARVLSVRITHSDGIASEGDIICALGLVAEQVLCADDPAAMIDVVSLSLGYFDESPTLADLAYTSGLWQAVELLLGLGVVVVAAAGNYSTSQPFYPAAFTELLPPADTVPLISVGALNPNGSRALFSDDGGWVSAWAAGAAVLSTFPDDIDASRRPEVRVPGRGPSPAERTALDPDDYRGGFAVWSGTSFAAPMIAALVARSLKEGAAGPGGRKLNAPGAAAARDRAKAALTSLKRPG